MRVDRDQTWAARALCASAEPDALFVQGAAQRQARSRCFSCEVRLECLADALNSETAFGVWGGLTERERRAMLRRYPHVRDWNEWLFKGDDKLALQIRTQRSPRVLVRAQQQ